MLSFGSCIFRVERIVISISVSLDLCSVVLLAGLITVGSDDKLSCASYQRHGR